eukprot:gnl/MRDRNA2_/MRDRNA2_172751_c0_seq1.p1 gnl/MRDRNA2_/MRDRNA2_172751_c0~~gnl/MRDRNA2_/MRDRNA2_172751_c0_seq1.p1  ORF type:complete len:104 (+),score=27.40 gnl/MRDRNA2_/MRDRNA2_172751_c0_seq1:63-374(+)
MAKKAKSKAKGLDGRMPLTTSVASKKQVAENEKQSAAAHSAEIAAKARVGRALLMRALSDKFVAHEIDVDSVPLDDPYAEKLRLQRLVEKADMELCADLFSGC